MGAIESFVKQGAEINWQNPEAVRAHPLALLVHTNAFRFG